MRSNIKNFLRVEWQNVKDIVAYATRTTTGVFNSIDRDLVKLLVIYSIVLMLALGAA